MRLEGVELLWLDMHLRRAHDTSSGSFSYRPIVVVRAVTDEAEGFGECAALAEPSYTEEFAAGAWQVLADHLVPALSTSIGLVEAASATAERPWKSVAKGVSEVTGHVKGNRMAKAALEMAVLDSWLRSRGESLREAVGVARSEVPAGAVVGIRSSVSELLDDVEGCVDGGCARVKVKIAPGWDTAPMRAVRDRFPDLALQADANGSYGRDDFRLLKGFDELDLLCLEQPLDEDDLVGSAALAVELATPVCLDESVSSRSRLGEVLRIGACDVVCVKPGRLGGLREAVAVHDVCVAAGIPLWCGGMFETGLARSANAVLSALPGFQLPGDLAGGPRFVEEDPFHAERAAGGWARLYDGPGVGPAPDASSLTAVVTRRRWYPALG